MTIFVASCEAMFVSRFPGGSARGTEESHLHRRGDLPRLKPSYQG